ncbi:hypothetical protein [Nocardioides limicola]|uniref:hypothetical protein n=1 Tax=Nocardioides limicola TaxID=2803368 RepID=UPI00193BB02B|nr:hypothetical protein [Nocardioides sp. DJM-14]
MMIGMLGFWLLALAVVIVGVRSVQRPESRPSARQILDTRLASGDIDQQQHRELVAALTKQ